MLRTSIGWRTLLLIITAYACEAGGGAGTGVGDAGAPGLGDAVADLQGIWIATRDPAQLLNYKEGQSTPTHAVALAENPSYVEIIDGIAFYLSSTVLIGEPQPLYVQELESGAQRELVFAEGSAPGSMAFADGSLWITDHALDAVWRVNPSTLEIVGGARLDVHDGHGHDDLEIAAEGDSVYVASLFGDPGVIRLAASSGEW
jgi:streptogramin lyase